MRSRIETGLAFDNDGKDVEDSGSARICERRRCAYCRHREVRRAVLRLIYVLRVRRGTLTPYLVVYGTTCVCVAPLDDTGPVARCPLWRVLCQ